jgi:hypothetical protein
LAACAAALTALARGEEADDSSPIFGVKIPARYRGWELIAPSHEAGGFNELRGILGDAVAMKAYREGTHCAINRSIDVQRHGVNQFLAKPNYRRHIQANWLALSSRQFFIIALSVRPIMWLAP